ncbi:hypothetical protein X777_14703 [Ooceraea biroi]|uniref:Uncharacterized protein n=1 Tax=Ooceraea biroi TaxID=2015173 RepID=A0A026WSA3_OOCBI|nr:hypothetical protein X777_14703 [Ooceraea biroi]
MRNMLRTPRTIIFMILIFVSACSFTILEETSNSTVILTHTKNTSDDVTSTESVVTSVPYEGEKPENSSETIIERLSNETSSKDKKKKEESMDCHLAEETKDMLNCFFVTDDVAATQATENASQKMTDEMEQKVPTKFNDTYPPKIFPEDKDVKSIDNADEATRRRLNHTFYMIITPKKVTDAFSMGVENKDNGKNPAALLPVSKTSNVQDTSPGNNSEIASQKSADNEGMSGGMIVLTAMLTFSIATVIVYAGVIAYKRYLDYRCNRRLLLDNDSEFDANDLHHFEVSKNTYR